MAALDEYFVMLTDLGKQTLLAAQVAGENVVPKEIRIGDGNGEEYTPDGTETGLKNEVYSNDLTRSYIHPDNQHWIVFETQISADDLEFEIREVGLFDTDGNMLAIANFPTTVKPVVYSNVTKRLYIRIIVEVSNADNVELIVDPNLVLATTEHVSNEITLIQDDLDRFKEDVNAFVLTHNNDEDAHQDRWIKKDEEGMVPEEKVYPATYTRLGGIKVGRGLTVNDEGVIEVIGSTDSSGTGSSNVANITDEIGMLRPYLGASSPSPAYMVMDGSQFYGSNYPEFMEWARNNNAIGGGRAINYVYDEEETSPNFGEIIEDLYAIADYRNMFMKFSDMGEKTDISIFKGTLNTALNQITDIDTTYLFEGMEILSTTYFPEGTTITNILDSAVETSEMPLTTASDVSLAFTGRPLGAPQEDMVGPHSHVYLKPERKMPQSGSDTWCYVNYSAAETTYGNNMGPETRPTNISVLPLIRVLPPDTAIGNNTKLGLISDHEDIIELTDDTLSMALNGTEKITDITGYPYSIPENIPQIPRDEDPESPNFGNLIDGSYFLLYKPSDGEFELTTGGYKSELNALPIMTSNSQDGFTISSNYNTPYHVADRDASTSLNSPILKLCGNPYPFIPGGGGPVFVTVELPYKMRLHKYGITQRDAGYVGSGKFQIYDGDTWYDIGAIGGYTGDEMYKWKIPFDSPKASHVRFYFTACGPWHSAGGDCGILGMRLHEIGIFEYVPGVSKFYTSHSRPTADNGENGDYWFCIDNDAESYQKIDGSWTKQRVAIAARIDVQGGVIQTPVILTNSNIRIEEIDVTANSPVTLDNNFFSKCLQTEFFIDETGLQLAHNAASSTPADVVYNKYITDRAIMFTPNFTGKLNAIIRRMF